MREMATTVKAIIKKEAFVQPCQIETTCEIFMSHLSSSNRLVESFPLHLNYLYRETYRSSVPGVNSDLGQGGQNRSQYRKVVPAEILLPYFEE